jgi:late competence protein required for DNA uptake (superfamily II DNA/RNA helicase)
MDAKDNSYMTKDKTYCQRCHGRMAFEKFYGQNGSFFGWHCVMCGDVLDPLILLHRLSHDANVSIPESQKELMALIKKYVKRAKAKNISIKIPPRRISSPDKFF